MTTINYKVRRYPKGHALYSEAVIMHTGDDGVERPYQACFGCFVKQDGAASHYTMERLDTLIPEGVYDYSLYFSPANGLVVILLHNVPHYSFIEHHIANWPFQLKGCTAHGLGIEVRTPELLNSRLAFIPLTKEIIEANPDAKYTKTDQNGRPVIGDVLGTITYETFT